LARIWPPLRGLYRVKEVFPESVVSAVETGVVVVVGVVALDADELFEAHIGERAQ